MSIPLSTTGDGGSSPIASDLGMRSNSPRAQANRTVSSLKVRSLQVAPGQAPSTRLILRQKIFTIVMFCFFIFALLPWISNQEFFQESDLYKSYLLRTKLLTWNSQITSTRAAVKDMRAMLEEYYGGPDILRNTLEMQDYNATLHEEGLHFIAEKMARSMVWKDQFVIGAIGNSVTAGHDNCNYDSYERQLQRLMKPIWELINVDFQVRNAGMGKECGDTFKNQIWCMKHLLGEDVDLVHYSWTYDEAVDHAGDTDEFHEMFFRWSLLMPHSPAPQLLYTAAPQGSGDSALAEAGKALLARYGRYGANVVTMDRGLVKHGYQRKGNGEVGDGLHDTTREGEKSEDQVRRESLGVVFRNWNPGPLLNQMTADALAYHYSDAMLKALDWVEAAGLYASFRKWLQHPPAVKVADLPARVKCREEWCGTEAPPACYTTEHPTFGKSDIAILEDPTHDLYVEGRGPWIEWTAEQDPSLIPREERDWPWCRHLDQCAGLRKQEGLETGLLTFDLPQMQTGFIAVCCLEGENCGNTMVGSGVEFMLENRTLPGPYVPLFGKCVQAQAAFQEGWESRAPHQHVAVRLPKESGTITISHVIAL